MRARLAWSLLVVTLPATGCGSDDDRAPEPPATGPLVTYQRTGGIAGVTEKLTVERGGEATLVVGFDRVRIAFELPAAELNELEAELEAADLEAIEKAPADAVCSDCFVYEITYEDETITFNDLDRPPESVSTLLAHLDEIAMSNYPPSEARA